MLWTDSSDPRTLLLESRDATSKPGSFAGLRGSRSRGLTTSALARAPEPSTSGPARSGFFAAGRARRRSPLVAHVQERWLAHRRRVHLDNVAPPGPLGFHVAAAPPRIRRARPRRRGGRRVADERAPGRKTSRWRCPTGSEAWQACPVPDATLVVAAEAVQLVPNRTRLSTRPRRRGRARNRCAAAAARSHTQSHEAPAKHADLGSERRPRPRAARATTKRPVVRAPRRDDRCARDRGAAAGRGDRGRPVRRAFIEPRRPRDVLRRRAVPVQPVRGPGHHQIARGAVGRASRAESALCWRFERRSTERETESRRRRGGRASRAGGASGADARDGDESGREPERSEHGSSRSVQDRSRPRPKRPPRTGLQTAIAWLIAKRRAPKSRAAYDSIGGGSPILKYTNEQARLLEHALNADGGSQQFKCYVAMRYWHPSAAGRRPNEMRGLWGR